MKTVNYKDNLLRKLKSPSYAAKYLGAVFQESWEDSNWGPFGIALRDVIESQGSLRSFAKRAKLSRQHLYRIFEPNANPSIKTISSILSQVGFKLSLEPKGRQDIK